VSEETYLGSCEEAAKRFGIPWACCISCHDEWAEGYGSPMEKVIEGEGYFNLCCQMINTIDALEAPHRPETKTKEEE
jgi:hypothetical protein